MMMTVEDTLAAGAVVDGRGARRVVVVLRVRSGVENWVIGEVGGVYAVRISWRRGSERSRSSECWRARNERPCAGEEAQRR